MLNPIIVYADYRLADYHFGEQHPFGPARFGVYDKVYPHKD